MDALPAIVGITAVIWVAIGILMHAVWVRRIFIKESEIISQQQAVINSYGYGAISKPRTLSSKKLFVFGYWGKDNTTALAGQPDNLVSSPAIFTFVNINLIAFTSIALLVIVSKGLFHALGIF